MTTPAHTHRCVVTLLLNTLLLVLVAPSFASSDTVPLASSLARSELLLLARRHPGPEAAAGFRLLRGLAVTGSPAVLLLCARLQESALTGLLARQPLLVLGQAHGVHASVAVDERLLTPQRDEIVERALLEHLPL